MEKRKGDFVFLFWKIKKASIIHTQKKKKLNWNCVSFKVIDH
jgi:hypothetical protein